MINATTDNTNPLDTENTNLPKNNSGLSNGNDLGSNQNLNHNQTTVSNPAPVTDNSTAVTDSTITDKPALTNNPMPTNNSIPITSSTPHADNLNSNNQPKVNNNPGFPTHNPALMNEAFMGSGIPVKMNTNQKKEATTDLNSVNVKNNTLPTTQQSNNSGINTINHNNNLNQATQNNTPKSTTNLTPSAHNVSSVSTPKFSDDSTSSSKLQPTNDNLSPNTIQQKTNLKTPVNDVVKPNSQNLITSTPQISNKTEFDKISSNSNSNNNNNSGKIKPKKKFNLKMVLGSVALLFIIVGAGAGFYLTQYTQQDIRQQASGVCSPPDGTIGNDGKGGCCGSWNGTDDSGNSCTVNDSGGGCNANDYPCNEQSVPNGACASNKSCKVKDPTTKLVCKNSTCAEIVCDPSNLDPACDSSVPTCSTNEKCGSIPLGGGSNPKCSDYTTPTECANNAGSNCIWLNDACTENKRLNNIVPTCTDNGNIKNNTDDNLTISYSNCWKDYKNEGHQACLDGAYTANCSPQTKVLGPGQDSELSPIGNCGVWQIDTAGGSVNCSAQACLWDSSCETTTTYSCNSSCTTDSQCSDVNSDWTCDDTTNKCRLASNPTSTTCQPSHTAEIIPECKNISMLDDTGTTLDPTKTFEIDMKLRFQCTAVDPDSQITRYEFKINEPDGNVVEGAAINPSGTSSTSLEYQISKYGKYTANCRYCTATECGDYVDAIPKIPVIL